MPLMADWSDRLIKALDANERRLAASIGLSRGLDGKQFEEALGAWLRWLDTRSLQKRFANFGGQAPGDESAEVSRQRQRETRRIGVVLKTLNTTLFELFGRRAINDGFAQQAYRVLLKSLPLDDLVCVTTNYDIALEIGLSGAEYDVDSGFVSHGYGATPVFTPSGMLKRARSRERIPVLHLHGAVGWYEKDSEVLEIPGDRPFNETLGTPVVLYPNPDKEPTRDALVADLWGEFKQALDEATHVLVIGHSLHDPALVGELKRAGSKVGVIVFDGGPHGQLDRDLKRGRELLPEAVLIPGSFSTEPRFSGEEYAAWRSSARQAA